MPGAWLQAPAKTRLIGSGPGNRPQAPDAGRRPGLSVRSYARHLLVGRCRHCVDPGTHRSVAANALAHGFDVFGPGHAEQGRVVHQELAVGAEHIELADVAGAKRLAFFVRQLVFVEELGQRRVKTRLHGRLSVEVIEKLLRSVEAHRRLAFTPRPSVEWDGR